MENIISHDKKNNIIKIDLSNFYDDCEYNKIINCIKNNYDKKNDIYLVIETKKLKIEKISISKLYKFSTFLKEYKKRNIQYLKKTTINIYNKATYDILYNLFTYLSEPIAKIVVNLYDNNEIVFIKNFYPSK
tara:strand:+ start:1812 stop:2207 length:396 start_codon:yes stop_codon:yes gene_type:complete